jgi:hypothetical protein
VLNNMRKHLPDFAERCLFCHMHQLYQRVGRRQTACR